MASFSASFQGWHRIGVLGSVFYGPGELSPNILGNGAPARNNAVCEANLKACKSKCLTDPGVGFFGHLHAVSPGPALQLACVSSLVQQFHRVTLPQRALHEDGAINSGHAFVGLCDPP